MRGVEGQLAGQGLEDKAGTYSQCKKRELLKYTACIMEQNNSFDLPKAFDPHASEATISNLWEKGDFFKANPHSNKPAYCIVMPPPNVTGVLHMGHALVTTLQDILIRWKRMSGFEALWIPGTDHAGIATQTVVERYLAAQGKRRTDYPREEFIKIVWEWKEKHEKVILSQLKRMGASCDFSRLRFTMDEGCNKAVNTIFKRLYEEGLIYRGDYLVNWDPVAQTALADDEVEYEERDGSLWYFKFPLKDGSEHCCIATTRPETMLGDVAVAVNNNDARYRHLIGKMILHPLTQREIPIIADPFVDPEFGTGMVKITPAHDPNDYQMAFRHNLEMINVLTPDGKINENGGAYQGMSRETARVEIVKKMQSLSLVETIKKHRNRVGVSYRSKAVIEPYLSKQWFVKMEPLKEQVSKRKESVKLIPGSWENTYDHWMKNLRNWCISRQLWWGHRIPIWYHKDDPEKMVCGVETPPEVTKEPEKWVQDSDVLDTWFSSALWPFSTLGWPEKTPELEKFYPNSVLITGHDILFFWVARMIFMGEYALKELPFPETFLHGLIFGKSYWKNNPDGGITYIMGEERKEYDLGKTPPKDVHSKWEKLSKTKGNVIDPLEMIQDYGTDAVRLSLCACANQSPQIDLDRRKFEEFKNFANKVWNGARFTFMHLEGLSTDELAKGFSKEDLALEDRWILSCLNKINCDVNQALANYSFDKAADSAYNFFWKEFCAYYLEIAKPVLFGKEGTPKEKVTKQKILAVVLCNVVRLLHPMTPFITEELFQLLKKRFPGLTANPQADPYTQEMVKALSFPVCSLSPYPQLIVEADISTEIEEGFALVEKVVYTVRNIRGEMKIPPATATDIFIATKNPLIRENIKILKALVKTNRVEVSEQLPKLSTISATGALGETEIMIPLPQELAQAEKGRLVKEREKLLKTIESLRGLLSNSDFHSRASPEVVSKQKEALHSAEKELDIIQNKLTLY